MGLTEFGANGPWWQYATQMRKNWQIAAELGETKEPYPNRKWLRDKLRNDKRFANVRMLVFGDWRTR